MQAKRQLHSLSALPFGQERLVWGPQGWFIHIPDEKKPSIPLSGTELNLSFEKLFKFPLTELKSWEIQPVRNHNLSCVTPVGFGRVLYMISLYSRYRRYTFLLTSTSIVRCVFSFPLLQCAQTGPGTYQPVHLVQSKG
jgi:hypothetical protein